MKNIYLSSFICVLLMFQNSPTQGQNKLNEEKLTEDSSVISGRLKNGFTYYIRPVRQHMPDIELQLLVNAGSYLQAKDQVGMAHFLEHLAFKASENFPAGLQNDVQKLNKLNISKFDLKGHSGTRATEYTFKAPRARQEAIDAGFMWFKDIANGKLQLNEHDIDKERGIYKQEYIIRGGDNFEKFQRENQLRHKLFSRTENMEDFFSHIDNFKPEVLRRFYQDWYLPNRIALMVVGNIKNPAALENKIKRIFSDIPSSVKRQKIPNINSHFYERPSQFAVVEKKITNIYEPVEKLEFQLYYRDSITSKKLKTNAGRMRLLQWGFLFDILNNRFIEKEKGYNNNYKIRISHTFDDMTMPPSVKLEFHSSFDRYWDVLELAISSLKQLQEHGVSKREFEEIFKYRLKTNNKDFKQNSQFWFKQMNLHYLFGMPLTTEESVNNLLSSYTLEDFNSFVKENKLELPQDIGIISPKLEKPMDELEIRKGIRATYGKHTKPYTLTEGPEFLFSPSELKNFNNHPYTISKSAVKGVTEVKLKNGIKIILKNFQPNGINNDKIFIHGYTPNGALNFNPEHYFSAVNAPGFIKNSGVSKFDKYDLQQYLRGKNIFWHNINLYLHNLESGIKL
ncbi:insulinase family protein [Salegentibacter sp. LM13S]|uniref:M16 family metallopeptidase n=1 Tax=Salegentibacter lacus TaxID=2873599 RepID=UPI001CCB190B|nr:insulinase family protein [Salegentibacter lacus]MBZ9632003.1 insulinase family protein [Salegentibacter lacus]